MGCTRDPLAAETTTPLGGNVLILLTDDIGIDKTAIYGEHPTPAPTPNIDALASKSVLFRNAYAQPTCSPSRASLLTGRHPTRHGTGRWIHPSAQSFALPQDELTIPELLRLAPQAWTTALYGKWHLAGYASDHPAFHPLNVGFDHFVGILNNPRDAMHDDDNPGDEADYFNWEKDDHGSLFWTDSYLLTDSFYAAAAAIPTLPEPWFVIVATSGAHSPLHNPPAELLAEPLPEDATPLQQYTAMVEAVDTSIGGLLAGVMYS
ncbi:MAG TPA: sulfatase-like hydrolase/transferase, partial [Myxococcota bacterium]|nr:sulfatase-like hydrolase/transferase [Myxococcota bacterium]